MIDKKSQRGFSLLEILVALAIFALVSIAAYQQVSAVTSASTRMEEKYYALWGAENGLEQYFVGRKWPVTGEDVVEYEMAGREWRVSTVISETDNQDLRKLETSVFAQDNEENAVITLVRFIGKY